MDVSNEIQFLRDRAIFGNKFKSDNQYDNFTIGWLSKCLKEYHEHRINNADSVKCNCPKESTDIYDEFGNLLGWACLECKIIEQ